MELAQETYVATRGLPASERFTLGAQMRRAAVSIAANIAEGQGRGSDRDFARFVSIALGSAYELTSELLLAGRLGLLPPEASQRLLDRATQVSKMLGSLRKVLRR